MNPLQEAIGQMVATASKSPVPMLGPKGNLDHYARRLDPDHLLLLYIEWSPAHKANTYHASISRNAGKRNPGLAVAMSTLMSLESFLGSPALYVFEDHLLHWYWLVEGPDKETVHAATTQ